MKKKTRYVARFPLGFAIERTSASAFSLAWMVVVRHPEGGVHWDAGLSASKEAAERTRAHALSFLVTRPHWDANGYLTERLFNPDIKVLVDAIVDVERHEP